MALGEELKDLVTEWSSSALADGRVTPAELSQLVASTLGEVVEEVSDGGWILALLQPRPERQKARAERLERRAAALVTRAAQLREASGESSDR